MIFRTAKGTRVWKVLAAIGSLLFLLGLYVGYVRIRGKYLEVQAEVGSIITVSEGFCFSSSQVRNEAIYSCYTLGNDVVVRCTKGFRTRQRQVTIGPREPFVEFR